jgi:ubiquinone/menaquinone biosynthesis C-methylase UbiE
MVINADRLKTHQYHNANQLAARIRLHVEYSTNPMSLHRWFFDYLLDAAPAPARVLEIGCGRGDLWAENADRIPPGWQVTLSDFSAGMLADCHAHLGVGRFAYDVVDVQAIPYGPARYDVVIANHMLYHVPDLPAALAEIRRVLKPDGVLLAMTNGAQHLYELMNLAESCIPSLAEARNQDGFVVDYFNLENGADTLRAQFSDVQLERFPNSLEVTAVQPILDYLASMIDLSAGAVQQIEATVQRQLDTTGFFSITKDAGLFLARGTHAH